ncbi:MAG: hypothetical protein H0A75_06755 [Candidatus Methanofishera endochildressiae]|uniref:Uncharacterized protein n=1 Tax=Candidatus Methanofishera endochildressiae TaxID=2738884 RepID=A0A7Z0MPE8_9GAMM|nr:hypothetical protein [Candidatus Methanofishera endochildressiae]
MWGWSRRGRGSHYPMRAGVVRPIALPDVAESRRGRDRILPDVAGVVVAVIVLPDVAGRRP